VRLRVEHHCSIYYVSMEPGRALSGTSIRLRVTGFGCGCCTGT
jgi:hypothetical protein